MARTRNQLANVADHTTIMTPGLRAIPTPSQRPAIMEPRQPDELAFGGPYRLPQMRK